jgi:hypothetical protein
LGLPRVEQAVLDAREAKKRRLWGDDATQDRPLTQRLRPPQEGVEQIGDGGSSDFKQSRKPAFALCVSPTFYAHNATPMARAESVAFCAAWQSATHLYKRQPDRDARLYESRIRPWFAFAHASPQVSGGG